MGDERPVTAAEFAALMAPLVSGRTLALGVSGGPDSTALLLLAAAWAKARGVALTALTVDHGLRPESAAEALAVKRLAARHGVAHATLLWQGAKPAANLQAEARDARYRLMGAWCRAAGVSELLLAHTEDDQAETFLLRLARGSGVDGLAAMAPRTRQRGLWLVRPLLGLARARLLATVAAHGETVIEDPSNRDRRFARVRMREAQPALTALGLTPGRLAATARRLARAREALERATGDLLAQAAEVSDAGFCRLDTETLATAEEEIGLRALARIIMAVGGLDYRPRLDRLERLYRRLAARGLGAGLTLGGCRILPAGTPSAMVLIVREPGAMTRVPVPLDAGQSVLWDGRFRVSLAAAPSGPAEVRGLGMIGLHRLERRFGQRPHVLPAAARPALPALYIGGRLAAVPHLKLADPHLSVTPGSFSAAFTGL